MAETADWFAEAPLRRFAEEVLARAGAPAVACTTVIDSLVYSDLRGVYTHGLVRLGAYVEEIRRGEVVPDASPQVVRRAGAIEVLSAMNGFGAVAGVCAVDRATSIAADLGIGLVVVKDGHHFGAAGFYSERAAAHGYVALVMSNTPGVMAPVGGREAVLGNNPLAFAVPAPAPGETCYLLDMAQSVGARGKVKLAELAGEQLPAGWAIDATGLPTTDPSAALDGALLPSGGYKGYGLALMVELMTAVLAGSSPSFELAHSGFTARRAESGAGGRRATILAPGAATAVTSSYLALAPAVIGGDEQYPVRTWSYLSRIGSSLPASGAGRVILPGERERDHAANRLPGQVPLERSTVALLEEVGATFGIPLPNRVA